MLIFGGEQSPPAFGGEQARRSRRDQSIDGLVSILGTYWLYSGRSKSGYHMRSAASVLAPPLFATEAFTDATTAVARLEEIYDRNTRFFAITSKRMSMASRSQRAYAPPIRLCALRPRPMRGSIHASRTASSQVRGYMRLP